MSNFLAIDQGTTSSRAIIFSSNHELITDSQEEYSLSYPNDGWVEAEPNEILRTVKQSLEQVLKEISETITCCGITNQRETTVVWSAETGELPCFCRPNNSSFPLVCYSTTCYCF